VTGVRSILTPNRSSPMTIISLGAAHRTAER
jgi:hypothetical protein